MKRIKLPVVEKLDLTKKYKSYYSAEAEPQLVEIEPAQYLSILGKGDPSGKAFLDNIQALYATAYGIKFMFKAFDKDFVVAKLEGLWWFDEQKYAGIAMADAPRLIPRAEWNYRLLIRMPEFVTQKELKEAVKSAVSRKQILLANHVELFHMHEGRCVQVMHIGPFETEPETLEKIKQFMDQNQLPRNGVHHEIYLSDFNRTAPEKLKTILREPTL